MRHINQLQLRVHGSGLRPTLVYCPGLHGDWTLVSGLRGALSGQAAWIEFTYPHRLDWQLPDYAIAIEDALRQNGVESAWLIGESFGSQVAWALLGRAAERRRTGQPGFQPQGLVLAGGFVRYPMMWGVRLVEASHHLLTLPWIVRLVRSYATMMKLRFRRRPEVVRSLDEFVANRSVELDRQCILKRYELIRRNDPRPVAQAARLPVYYLTGFWDVIVWWIFVQPWLKRHVPGYRGWRLAWNAEHNVLGATPEKCARQILQWASNTNGPPHALDGCPPG